ncbi:[FeFe] hydrogenase H-cluster maturation GTPase HydF [Clostridium moniliforme]|uniref:[FeFe] hydrogenase H-cluster maturation GTPase HydF n=1 Tax=Clostridium moniliforme TaxID=39489 RepID=A0ABS4EZH9_9CLOT|nr:[FeFe] hydrogenase H-cluster maturation GTPase HydF [Clostridium moniliforme]MBP1889410.1 [FeFe] hydrogenase H-cluster maturation GTPase HydF [Clostridium moniliforme]
MNNTPNANRKHIAIFGNTNSGKSSLMNKILGQEMSLVSEVMGTTTDPVQKAMELIPVGPILLIDTAGLEDTSELGTLRIKKTMEVLKKTDVAVFVLDASSPDFESFNKWKIEALRYNIPFIIVANKAEVANKEIVETLKDKYEDVICTSTVTNTGIEELKKNLVEILEKEEDEKSLIGDLVPYNGKVVLVVPVDSEAPKGRLILPQVQLIRDCLDNGIKSYVVRDTELEGALKDLKDIDLVITDSQAFKRVSEIVPKDIKLTSFSILFARQKGDLNKFIEGVNKIRNLKPNDNILISESCTHNVSHEDIGRVKIPKLLEKYVGGKLNFTFRVGHDFPENIEKYDLIIHCGACMINRKTVLNRVKQCYEKEVPITNYGVVLAFLTGILDRSTNNLI